MIHSAGESFADSGPVNRELLFINFISTTCLAIVMVYCTAFTFVIILLLNVLIFVDVCFIVDN